jgi:redox-sensitive bicupin YhaK (pirin superfamily)
MRSGGALGMALRRSVARRGRASAPLDPEAEEWSIYVVEGEVNIAARHSIGAAPHLSSGGQRAACERYFLALRHWRPTLHLVEFCLLAQERIEQAKEDWKTGKFAPVPGETEFL